MPKKFFRPLALLLAAICILTLFAGCSQKSATVFTVNGEKVKYEDFMAHLFFTKYDLFSGYVQNGQMRLSDLYILNEEMLSEKLDDQITLRDYLKAMTNESAAAAMIYRQLADKHKLSLTASDKNNIDSTMSSWIKSLGGAAAYNKFLNDNRMSENALRRYFQDRIYMEKLMGLFSDDGIFGLTNEERAKAKEQYGEIYMSARHILFATIDLTYKTPLSDEIKANKLASAKEVLKELQKGEDFEAMIEKHSDSKDGLMTFRKGEMDEKFEKAAFDLNVGEMSDIVESFFGYHIILREPLAEDRLEEYYNIAKSEKFSIFINEAESIVNSKKLLTNIDIR